MLHIRQRCESHQYNMLVTRPYIVYTLPGPMFALSRLLRTKQPRERLQDVMKRLAILDLKRSGIKIAMQPDAGSIRLLKFVQRCRH